MTPDPHNLPPTQIAIDGPAASGKSTVARLLAGKLGAYYVNTGEIYRAVTWYVLQQGVDPEYSPQRVQQLLPDVRLSFRTDSKSEPREACLQLWLNDHPVDVQAIRAPEVTAKVSHLAAIPEVREWLIGYQRQSAALGMIVMEGRDIGTVIFPQARFKFFIMASPEERARRRLAQSGEVMSGATLQSVIDEIAQRDHIDSTRSVAPLRPAADAVVIDTSRLTITEVIERIIEHMDRSPGGIGN